MILSFKISPNNQNDIIQNYSALTLFDNVKPSEKNFYTSNICLTSFLSWFTIAVLFALPFSSSSFSLSFSWIYKNISGPVECVIQLKLLPYQKRGLALMMSIKIIKNKKGWSLFIFYLIVNTWKILHWELGRQVSSDLQVLSTSSTAPRPQTIKHERRRSQYTRLCNFEPPQSLSMVDPRSLLTERLQLLRLPCHNWFKLVWGFTLPGK